MIGSLRLVAAGVAGVVCAVPLVAQRHLPATYAITGARIVPVSGPAIDQGTIVIRDGVIAAVGPAVTAPADARIVDGTGLTVYPGLIDAYGSLGQRNTAPATGSAGGSRGGAAPANTTAREAAPNSNHPVGLQPEISVVDELVITTGEFDAAHAAGITAALTGIPNGIFRGQSALINLDGDSVSRLILKTGISQNIGFSRGGGGFGGGGRGGYPGTLFGAFASLRQELLDAQHYRDVKAAYDRNPRGTRRPDFDASLEALLPVLSRQQPVIMQANTEREIIRALDLAKEFNLKAVIAGGAEAYKVTGRLKAENVPVLLTLNFPRAGTTAGGGGRGGGGGDPGDPEPLRLLRDRVMAPKGPGILARDGVSFVFMSGANYAEMLVNLRKAVTAGLPAEQAIKALTWAPAEFFGVADRLGSIEAGKIANLTITRGSLLDSTVKVMQVFIDGVPTTIPAAAPGAGNVGGGRGGRAGPGLDASGVWRVTVSIDGRDRDVTLHLRQDDRRIYGAVQGDLGAAEILNGTIERDGTFYFTAMVSLGNASDEAAFSGAIVQGGIRGQVDVTGHKSGVLAGSHSN